MLEINAFDLLVRSLQLRHFEISTSFGSFGKSFEALRSFSTGDYYLFTLTLDNDAPLLLEISQSGQQSITEFHSLVSVVDVKRILSLCEETRFPYSW